MLLKFFTPLDLVCSYIIPIRKHYFLTLFFLLITPKLCFSSVDLFQSQTLATSKDAYQTTFPNKRRNKCQLPNFLKSRTTGLPTFIQLLLFSSIHKRGTVQPTGKSSSLSRCFGDNLFQTFKKFSTNSYSLFFQPLKDRSRISLLLCIRAKWFLSSLRSFQDSLLNDRLPQSMSSSISVFVAVVVLLCNIITLKSLPITNLITHHTIPLPFSLLQTQNSPLFAFSFPSRPTLLGKKNHISTFH